MTKPKAKTTLELPVSFGNLNIGETTARLEFAIERDRIKIGDVDHTFCNSRLEVSIDVAEDQTWLDGMKPPPVVSVIDAKSFSANAKRFKSGLTFALKEIDTAQLAKFARRDGTLKAKRIGEIPDDGQQPKMFDDGEEGEGKEAA